MNVLVVGKGGREHSLVWKLAQSQRIKSSTNCAKDGLPGRSDNGSTNRPVILAQAGIQRLGHRN